MFINYVVHHKNFTAGAQKKSFAGCMLQAGRGLQFGQVCPTAWFFNLFLFTAPKGLKKIAVPLPDNLRHLCSKT
jgi:hypothetical protein